MNIDHANLARLDLNLLVALDALVTEGSVTRAAARVGLGQSAMSHNLARLRALFGDELLVRGPRGMQPTPRTLALVEPLRTVLAGIQATVLQDRAFDPATAERTFVVGISDSQEVALMPALLAHCRECAPGVRLRVRSTDRFHILDELDAGRLDLGLGSWTEGTTRHKRKHLFFETFLCLFDPRLVPIRGAISLADYLALPHVLGSLREDLHGVVDVALAGRALKREVVLATPHFLAVPFLLKRTAVIATLPARLARFFAATLDLKTCPAPIELPTVSFSLLWHASSDHDPGHRWLRRTVEKLVTDRTAGFGRTDPRPRRPARRANKG